MKIFVFHHWIFPSWDSQDKWCFCIYKDYAWVIDYQASCVSNWCYNCTIAWHADIDKKLSSHKTDLVPQNGFDSFCLKPLPHMSKRTICFFEKVLLFPNSLGSYNSQSPVPVTTHRRQYLSEAKKSLCAVVKSIPLLETTFSCAFMIFLCFHRLPSLTSLTCEGLKKKFNFFLVAGEWWR